MADETDRQLAVLNNSRSRRAALGSGAILAALGSCSLRRSALAQATPDAMAVESDVLLVQSFSQGSLFPTQGDVGVLPYTVILWDAADRGFFFADGASAIAGVIPTERVLSILGAEGETPRAVLVAPVAAENGSTATNEAVWALRLAYGALGSDPGAVTYQGESLPDAEAAAWIGMAPVELPAGPQVLSAGYLIIAGLSGFDANGGDGVGVRLTMR